MNKKVVKSSVLTLALMMVMVFAMSITVYAASAPAGLQQTDAGSSSVDIAWNAVVEQGVYGYNVYYSADGVNWVRNGSGDCDTTSPKAYISNLSAGASYFVAVKTVVRTGTSYKDYQYIEGEMSAPIEVVTCPDLSNYEVVQSDATTNSVTITANGAIGANYFEAYVGDYCVAASNAATFNTQVALTPATKYAITVYAARVSSAGFPAVSTWGYDTVYAKTLAKKIDTDNFGITSEYDNINVYYFGAALGDGQECDGYQWQFKTASGKTKKNVTQTGNSLRLEKFIQGTFYQYRIRTYVETSTGKKYSKWSDYNYIGLSKDEKDKCVISGRKIKASWGKVSGATGYTVYISTKKNSGYKKVKTLGKKGTSITITKYNKKSLKKGKTYYVKVVAQAKIGKKTRKSGMWRYWECKI